MSRKAFEGAALACLTSCTLLACSLITSLDDVSPRASGGDDASTLPDTNVTDSNVADTSKPCPTDAGMMVCGSSCIDPTSDGANCGACGHDCGGGQCTASVCQPVILATVAKGGSSLCRIATDGTHVVYSVDEAASNGGGVFSLSVNGAAQTPTTIASSAGTNEYARPITIVNGNVYWLQRGLSGSPGTAWKGKAGTPGATQLADVSNLGFQPIMPFGIAVDSGETYLGYVEYDGTNNRDLYGSCPLPSGNGGSSVSPIGSELGPPGDMVTDGKSFFWTQISGKVARSSSLAWGVTVDFASNQASPQALVINGGYVYWANAGSATIHRSAIANPSDTPLATAAYASSIAADAKYVYWSEQNAIRYVDFSGTGTAQTLATATNARWIARDATAIYWLDKGDGTIRKVALPL